MNSKNYGLLFFFFLIFSGVSNAQIYNLEECRKLAIENNKSLKVASEQERVAYYQKKEAFLKYFPKVSASGMYVYLNKDLHLIGKDQIPKSISTPVIPLPSLGTQIPSFPIPVPERLRESLYKAGEIDLSNMWVGNVSLTQPIFAGGRIVALNDIRTYALELATVMKETTSANVIVEVDEAYWQVVSLSNKKKLATSYVELLNKMDSDVALMEKEGVATKADRLSVNVKLNEAEMTLTKVENGVALSKMLLCQVCGIDLNSEITLWDEVLEELPVLEESVDLSAIEGAIQNRSEIRSLELVNKIKIKQEKIALAEFLPTAGLMVGYTLMNPNLEEGMQKKFGGMMNVAVQVKVPLNFLSSSAKLNVAKAETRIKEYELEETKEKIKLQINQAAYKLTEAERRLKAASKNSEKANENLRYAKVGFEEGVIASSDVLSAHTAWLAANSEMIDAQIDIKLSQVYLNKALGRKN